MAILAMLPRPTPIRGPAIRGMAILAMLARPTHSYPPSTFDVQPAASPLRTTNNAGLWTQDAGLGTQDVRCSTLPSVPALAPTLDFWLVMGIITSL
jgi:hypothetical protein